MIFFKCILQYATIFRGVIYPQTKSHMDFSIGLVSNNKAYFYSLTTSTQIEKVRNKWHFRKACLTFGMKNVFLNTSSKLMNDLTRN